MYISDVDYEEMICEIEFRSYSYALITNEQVRNYFEIFIYDFPYSGPSLEVVLHEFIEIIEQTCIDLKSDNTDTHIIPIEKVHFNSISYKQSDEMKSVINLHFNEITIGHIWIEPNGLILLSFKKDINKDGNLNFDLKVFIQVLKDAEKELLNL